MKKTKTYTTNITVNGFYRIEESGFSSKADARHATFYAEKILTFANYTTAKMLKFAGVGNLDAFHEKFWAAHHIEVADPVEAGRYNLQRALNGETDRPIAIVSEDCSAKEKSEGKS